MRLTRRPSASRRTTCRREDTSSDCFLRRYSCGTAGDDQLLITSFHADTASLTVNVALTSDADVDGGQLLGVFDGEVRLLPRSEGDVTVHSSSLLHGVTRMRRGSRYSMILVSRRSRARAHVDPSQLSITSMRQAGTCAPE